jgi:site-specific DNA-methyltransferase (adenine-specific)
VTPYYDDERATIYHGDAAEVIVGLPDASVDCVVTSPPYAEQRATTYGGIPEADYPAWTVAWMEPLRRVLKPRGSVIINIRPHVRDGTISDYTLRTRLAIRGAGWLELDELLWIKPDAMPTAPNTRPRRSWESLHWFGLRPDAYSAPTANGSPHLGEFGEINSRPTRLGWKHGARGSSTMTSDTSRCRDWVSVAVRCNPNDSDDTRHPAPYPTKVAGWCIRLVCPPGGTVLDPFSGSGSTGVAALQEGRRYIGIDLAEEYAAMSARRVAKEPLTLDIFGGAA